MKIGIRTPSLKRSIKARTTGRLKRQLKKSVNPLYGKKGMGLVSNPKKSLYNQVYKKTTVDPLSSLKKKSGQSIPVTVSDTNVLNKIDTLNLSSNDKNLNKQVFPASHYKLWMVFWSIFALFTLLTPLCLVFFGIMIYIYVKKVRNNPYKRWKDIPEEYKPKRKWKDISKENKPNKKVRIGSNQLQADANIISELFSVVEKEGTVASKTKDVSQLLVSREIISLKLSEIDSILDKYYNSNKFQKVSPVINATAELKNKLHTLEEEFIARYYLDNVKKADRLKTKEGRQKNLQRGKERLLEYKEDFSEKTIDLIEQLYEGEKLENDPI